MRGVAAGFLLCALTGASAAQDMRQTQMIGVVSAQRNRVMDALAECGVDLGQAQAQVAALQQQIAELQKKSDNLSKEISDLKAKPVEAKPDEPISKE